MSTNKTATDLQLLGVSEAATLLGVSAKTIRRLMRAGRLPSVRLGRRRLLPAAKLKRLLLGGDADNSVHGPPAGVARPTPAALDARAHAIRAELCSEGWPEPRISHDRRSVRLLFEIAVPGSLDEWVMLEHALGVIAHRYNGDCRNPAWHEPRIGVVVESLDPGEIQITVQDLVQIAKAWPSEDGQAHSEDARERRQRCCGRQEV